MPVAICVKPSIDCALGKTLRDIHITGLGYWWISRGGGGSQPPERQKLRFRWAERSPSKNDLICAVNSYYLACGFSTPFREANP
jgi:hypothetical protein